MDPATHDKGSESELTLTTNIPEETSKHISSNYFNKSFASIARSMSDKSKTLPGFENQQFVGSGSAPPVVVFPPPAFLSPPSNRNPTHSGMCFLKIVLFTFFTGNFQPNYSKNYLDPIPLLQSNAISHENEPLTDDLSQKKQQERRCFQSRPKAFLIALSITVVLIGALSLLVYFLFPRVPSVQFLALRQLTPSDNTLKFEDSSIRFLIDYEALFAMNSTNYIPWHLGPINVLVKEPHHRY